MPKISKVNIRFLLFIWGGVLLMGCASNTEVSLISKDEENTICLDSVLEQILNTEEENINLGKYALLLTKAVYPQVDLNYELKKIDTLANAVRPRLMKTSNPEEIVSTLNRFFFEELEFRGQLESDGADNLNLLHNVFSQRRGDCVSLSISYLCLAERLNLPVHGVSIPMHFFVRYDDGAKRINIETTSGEGQNISDDEYLKEMAPWLGENVNDQKIRKELLKNLTKKESLSAYLRGIAVPVSRNPQNNSKLDYISKLKCADFAIKVNPNSFYSYSQKGFILLAMGMEKGDLSIFKQALECFQISHSKFPQDLETISGLAIVYSEMNEYEKCIEKVDEFINKYYAGETMAIRKRCKEDLELLIDIKKFCKATLKQKIKGNSNELNSPNLRLK